MSQIQGFIGVVWNGRPTGYIYSYRILKDTRSHLDPLVQSSDALQPELSFKCREKSVFLVLNKIFPGFL